MNINYNKIKIMKQFAQMVPGTNDLKIKYNKIKKDKKSDGKLATHIDDTPMHLILYPSMETVPWKRNIVRVTRIVYLKAECKIGRD